MKALVVALLVFSTPCTAHSFYEYECCSNKDCWPMGTEADAKEPAPKIVPGGYMTHDGIFISQSNTRPSPDGRFHICRSGGLLKGDMIRPTGRPVCFYAPPVSG